jgi:hypothetical protein
MSPLVLEGVFYLLAGILQACLGLVGLAFVFGVFVARRLRDSYLCFAGHNVELVADLSLVPMGEPPLPVAWMSARN